MKRPGYLFLFAAVVTVAAILVSVPAIDRYREQARETNCELSPQELQMLQAGDVVLRMGYGIVSSLLEASSGGNGVSHCGIVTGTPPDFGVIHAISAELADLDGVQECSLAEFVRGAREHSFVAVRCAVADGADILRQAERYLKLRVPFDLSFDLSDSTKIFCSELVYRSVMNASGVGIFDAASPDYSFTNFFDERFFRPLIDHRQRAD